jgi:multidrug resistance efflux pump
MPTSAMLTLYHRLQQQGAASAGEVKQAEDALQRAQADANPARAKKKGPLLPAGSCQSAGSGRGSARLPTRPPKMRFAKSSVRAPFDGIVYSLPTKQGAYVQTGDLLLQEGDLSQMLVRTFVDEPDIGRLATGQKIEVTWDAVPGRIWNGEVSTVPSTVKLRVTRSVGEVTCTARQSKTCACCRT